jgi:hypothetical protein
VGLAVRATPLGFVKTRIASTEGWKLLRFCSSEWLDTTCIVAGLECLQGGYDNVGVITPEIAQMEDEESRKVLAGAHSAQAEDTESIIGIVNTSKQAGQHWVAFFIDRTANSCVVYDPLHSAANIASVEKLVASTIAPLLDVKLKVRAHVGMAQKDGHNCGVLCLLFLELMLADGEWLPTYCSQMPFFRMRYMKMTYALMRAHGDDEEV